jgi:hypothetical protein
MISSKTKIALMTLFVGLGLACGTGLSDPDAAPDLEIKLKVDFDTDTLDYALDGAPLIGAMYWVSGVDVPEVCLLPEAAGLLTDLCPDPFLVSGAWMASSVTIDPQATGFELTLDALPPFYTVVGDVNGRVAYGAVIVFSDADGDGVLTLMPKFSFDKPGGGGGRGGNKEETGDVDAWVSDRVVASSFYHLNEPQVRLIHKEGAFDLSSNFLPAKNCEEAPSGFSLLKQLTQDESGQLNACEIGSTAESIPMWPLDDDVDAQLSCTQNWAEWGAPQGCDEEFREWDEEGKGPDPVDYTDAICIRSDLLVLPYPDGGCGAFQTLGLAGCWSGIDCENKDWDCRETPPADWPCP